MRRLAFPTLALIALLAGCGQANSDSVAGGEPADAPKLTPVETSPPVGQGKPAFPGQTRAPGMKTHGAYSVSVLAKGLEHPWSIAVLPDRRLLVTERPGRLRVVAVNGALSEPVSGLPKVDAEGQGGLFEVVLDPAFATNGLIYWSYAEPRSGGNGTAVARGRFVDGAAPRVEAVQVIFRQQPTFDSPAHFGGRLVFDRAGKLFVTLGERSAVPGRMQSQDLKSDLGKIVRINADGTIPADNPFVGKGGARPEIWSLGNRNVQGAALNPATGELWADEHGPQGGDEVNIIRAGKDYGWPTITYGREYDGRTIGKGITAQAGMEQPVYYWDPVIAASGMLFHSGKGMAEWKGNLFVGALGQTHLARLVLDGDKVIGEERLLVDQGKRIRDVREAADGSLLVATDEDEGEILRIKPGAAAQR